MELDIFIDSRHTQSFGTISVPLHKHRWQVRVTVQEPGQDHTVVRSNKVLSAVTSTLQPFDGVILNDVYPFTIIEPTHDNIAMYFYNCLEDALAMMNLKLIEMSLWEDQDLIKQITQRNTKFGALLRGEDILTIKRQRLPETVTIKRDSSKKTNTQMIRPSTRSS